ncbi:probable Dol-P-Man:Man(7)GlcNAc(2)-PP-Dol alpha-1,6-mannosyltransferase [Argonauta hians]
MDVLENLMLLIMVIYVVLCPYTKVEESFNLQAMHDIIYHQQNISQYDHLEFSGVVPRSFIGPLLISLISAPFVFLAHLLGLNKLFMQHVVRYCLGLYILWSFRKFQEAVRTQFGSNTKFWLYLLTMTQFHFIFYMTRPLPNIMALGFVLLALHSWLLGKHTTFLWFSGIAIIIFRSDVCMLLGIYLLMDLITGKLCLKKAFVTIIFAGGIILGATVLIDSFFWQRWLWPEAEVFWFNTFHNKSSQWGISPFLWYFYSVLPRSLGLTTVLVPLGLYLCPSVRRVVFPAIIYIILYSFLPHKELRFIIYVFPVLNIAAAAFINKMWRNRKKSNMNRIFSIGIILHLMTNTAFSCCFLYLSCNNYPGGYAINELHKLEDPTSDVHVHIDVFTAQTGVSRFLQLNPQWKYNKTENLLPGSLEMQKFTHLLIGTNDEDANEIIPYKVTHDIMDNAIGFHRIKINWKAIPPIEIISIPKVWILKKK